MEEAELGLNEISDQILLTFKNALDGPCGCLLYTSYVRSLSK